MERYKNETFSRDKNNQARRVYRGAGASSAGGLSFLRQTNVLMHPPLGGVMSSGGSAMVVPADTPREFA